MKEQVLQDLLDLEITQGYVLFSDVQRMSTPEDYEWITNELALRFVRLYEQPPKIVRTYVPDEKNSDYARYDYEQLYQSIVLLAPSLTSVIAKIRNYKPPQFGEFLLLKASLLAGNMQTKNRVVEMYLRMALRAAMQRYQSFGYEVDMAFSDAIVGLLLFIKHLDFNNTSFTSSLLWHMYGSISRAQTTQNSVIYYPIHRKDAYILAFPLFYTSGCCNCPNFACCKEVINTIQVRCNCDQQEADIILSQCLPTISLEEVYPRILSNLDHDGGDEELYTFAEYFKVQETSSHEVYVQNVRNIVHQQLETLNKKEQFIIKHRFGIDDEHEEGKTLEEIGQMLGVTRERIRQIENKALRTLTIRIRKAMQEYGY